MAEHVATEFDAIFSESDLAFIEAYQFTNDASQPWSYADGALVSPAITRKSMTTANTTRLTLSITLKRDAVIKYIAAENRDYTRLRISVDGSSMKSLVINEGMKDVDTVLSAGAHTIAWQHYVTSGLRCTGTVSKLVLADPSAIVQVPLEKAGVTEDVVIDSTNVTTTNGTAGTTSLPGREIALHATDGTYSLFAGWYVGDTLISGNADDTYITPEGGATITARFADRVMDGTPEGWKVGVHPYFPWTSTEDGVFTSYLPSIYSSYGSTQYFKFTAAEASQLSFDCASSVIPENIASRLRWTLNNGKKDILQKEYYGVSGERVKLFLPAGAYTLTAEFYETGTVSAAHEDDYGKLWNLRLDSLAPFLRAREHRVTDGALVTVRRQTAAEIVRMADGSTLEERLDALAARVAKLQNGG